MNGWLVELRGLPIGEHWLIVPVVSLQLDLWGLGIEAERTIPGCTMFRMRVGPLVAGFDVAHRS